MAEQYVAKYAKKDSFKNNNAVNRFQQNNKDDNSTDNIFILNYSSRTHVFYTKCGFQLAPVAQLVEHHIGNVEVCGPIPHLGCSKTSKIFLGVI